MASDGAYELRPMSEEYLDIVLSWRNHPDVRRFMLSQHVISPYEHAEWFRRSSDDPRRRLYVLTSHGRPSGFASLIGVKTGGIADWGFYISPDAPRGTGSVLGSLVLGVAFDVECLHKVCGQALDFNEASRRLHARLGFLQEAVLREHAPLGGVYHDLVCFGILDREFGRRNL
jgi:UDP-4-amino-4,6-dideoxy-N-acetyl-beta-L-altrosamine N-acetyltransferase